MKTKNKIITALLLSAGSVAGIALLNKYTKTTAINKNLLTQPEPHYFKWRLGNIHYTKIGAGKPLLLIHDLNFASSGAEWDKLIGYLKNDFTVYIIDLLGCGRSEKPNLTYTNFLYVQLLNDFIKSEIGKRTNVITAGSSSSLAIMTCVYNPNLFAQMMFINPESFACSNHIPGRYAKIFKTLLDMPILGTLLYNIASSKKTIQETLEKELFYNPYEVKSFLLDQYYEAAHLGESPKAVFSSVYCNYTKCRINNALEKIDNSIYILGGEAEDKIEKTIQEYTLCNPAIESSIIAKTKHLPQSENPMEVLNAIKIFFQ